MFPPDDAVTAVSGDCCCLDYGGSDADYHQRSDYHDCPHCRKSDPSSSRSYSYALCEANSDKLRRIIYATVKGFSIGAGLKGGLSLFSLLASFSRRRSSNFAKKSITLLNNAGIVLAMKETLRYGLFLGTFAGTFVSVDEIIAASGGHRRTASWRALVAGGIAGPSILLTGLDTQHSGLAIYILMRAAVLASRCGIKSKRFGQIFKPLTWSHGDIFLMCLSSSQILSAYILKQDSLAASYKSFLNKHGGKHMAILQGVKDITSGIPFSNLEEIDKYYKERGVNVKLDPEMNIPCSIVHGNQSCGEHFITFLFEAYKRALPVYLPVYLVPALIVHRQGLLKRPFTILGKSGVGVARSSLFLSTYCSSAWLWTCILFRIFKRCNIPMVAMGTVIILPQAIFYQKEEFVSSSLFLGSISYYVTVEAVLVLGQFPTGLALAIEKKSRRMEISLYCLARAIESFFTCVADVGCLPPSMNIKRTDVAIFSVSTAIIMHCYAQERDVFRSKYLNVLDWVFGVPPPSCYTPRYKHN